MKELDIYIDKGTEHLTVNAETNMASVGHARKVTVLYIIGRFAFTSKTVIEYHLGISREAINKLFLRLVRDGLINQRKSFGSKDGAVYYLSAKGKRFISYEVDMEFNQKTDTSAHNSKTEIHDLSAQTCILDRIINTNGEYTAFVTEKELRELGYGTFGQLKQQRAVDGLLYDKSGGFIAVEVETANSKCIRTASKFLREDILTKYLNQLRDENALYSRVFFFSHRERFLKQIKNRHDGIITENKFKYSDTDINLINNNLKYINSCCPLLYNLFWNPDFKLEKSTHVSIELAAIQLALENLECDSSSNEYKNGFKDGFRHLKLID